MKRGDITILEALSRGESVGGSRFSESLLERLRDEHLLIASSHGSKVSYRAVDPAAIPLIWSGAPSGSKLSPGFGSPAGWTPRAGTRDGSQVEYTPRAKIGRSETMSRSEQVAIFGDSKVFRARSCPGFPVNSYEPVSTVLCGRALIIDPAPGSFLFISDWRSFEIPPDVVVVGVENMENFRMVRSQKYLFEHLCAPVLFVSRYPQSTDLVSWLGSIPNRYIHFGDLDLAGIRIFLTEFQRHLGPRAEFFIPPDADTRLARGSRDRYDTQLARFGSLSAHDPRLHYLISLIHKHHRGYDQEGFLHTRE